VKDAGADLVLLETLNSISEARAALEIAKSLGLPCWTSFVCDERGRLFTGETMAEMVAALEPLGVDAILLNCAPPGDINAGLKELLAQAHVAHGSVSPHRPLRPAGMDVHRRVSARALPAGGRKLEADGSAHPGRMLRHHAGSHRGAGRSATVKQGGRKDSQSGIKTAEDAEDAEENGKPSAPFASSVVLGSLELAT